MALTNAGRDLISAMVLGEATTDLNSANARLGVGDSTTAFAASQTDLIGTNARKAMNPGFPSRAANVLSFQVTFAETEANFAWNEVGTFNSSSGATMLTRKVQSFGIKPSSESWRLSWDVTIAVV